jgi:hypothetical protein
LLGHRDLKTTMRYAHFSPDHLLEAVRLNPLAKPVPGDVEAAESDARAR